MAQKTKKEILDIEAQNLVTGSNKLTMLKLEILIDIRDNLNKLNESINGIGSDIGTHFLYQR